VKLCIHPIRSRVMDMLVEEVGSGTDNSAYVLHVFFGAPKLLVSHLMYVKGDQLSMLFVQ